VHLLLVEITSFILIEQIIQFLVSYFIIDGIEQGTFHRWWGYIRAWYQSKFQRRGKQHKKNVIFREDYLDNSPSSEDLFSDEDSPLCKSWTIMDNVTVVEDSPELSVVVFQ